MGVMLFSWPVQNQVFSYEKEPMANFLDFLSYVHAKGYSSILMHQLLREESLELL